MFRRDKSIPVIVEAPLRFATPEDQHKGWIRVSEELRGGIESGAYVKIHSGGKTVYCQVRGTPRRSRIIQMNEYYRLKFGWQNPQDEIEISMERVGFWGKLRAIRSHPDTIVRVGFGLGCISVGLGSISVCFAGLSPSVQLIINTNPSDTPWGIVGLIATGLFVLAGVAFVVTGITSILSKQ